MKPKISYTDLTSVPLKELAKQHKMDQRQIEQQVRSHLDGASKNERNAFYENIYSNKQR